MDTCFRFNLPKEFKQLNALEHLNLNSNKIKKLPDSIRKLRNLKFLRLNKNKIEKLPKYIALLHDLNTLDISNNINFRNLPSSLRNLQNTLTLLDLRNTNIQEFCEGDTLGKTELREIFGDHVAFSDNPLEFKAIYTLDVLKQLQRHIPRININYLKSCVLADLAIINLSGEEMLAQWNDIWSKLNFLDEAQSGYIDFYTITNTSPGMNDPVTNQ